MNVIDTHAHLDQLEDLQGALANAAAAGVAAIVGVSMDVASSRKNLEIKNNHNNPKIALAMGMHPSEAKPGDIAALKEIIFENKSQLTAIGEIGLDFWYKWVKKDEEKKEEQRKVFCHLLEIGHDLGLPVIIHSRGAWQECLDIVKNIGNKKVLFHWYSGPVDVLGRILDEGFYVSTSPSLAYSPQSREAIHHAPIERTLIETDCPVFYRSDETDQGFMAEPKDVFRTLTAYAQLKNIPEEKAAQQLNDNAVQFFNLKGLF